MKYLYLYLKWCFEILMKSVSLNNIVTQSSMILIGQLAPIHSFSKTVSLGTDGGLIM